MKYRRLRLFLVVVLVAAGLVFVLGVAEGLRVWRATATLSRVGPADEELVPHLVSHLDDYNPMIREQAARGLGQIGPAAADEATPALVRALRDDAAPVRAHAAWALGRVEAGADAIRPLIAALDDEDGEVRRYAAFALTQRAALAGAAVPKLIERLDDPHMAYMAASALGEIGPPAKDAIPLLLKGLREEQSLARMAYVTALGKFGPDAKEAVPDLVPLLQDPHPDMRKAAGDALRNIDAAAAPPAEPGR